MTYRKPTPRDIFLATIKRIVPWGALCNAPGAGTGDAAPRRSWMSSRCVAEGHSFRGNMRVWDHSAIFGFVGEPRRPGPHLALSNDYQSTTMNFSETPSVTSPELLSRHRETAAPEKVTSAVKLLMLFAWAFALSLYLGRRGFMPLDQSIVFDGAYRVVSGQVPYRDFFVGQAVVSILVQAAWFKILGVSWFAYCFNAALLNGVSSLVCYRILRIFGLGANPAWLYSAASAVLFYAPMGTPFMVQDAFLLILVGLWFVLEAARTSRRPVRTFLGVAAGIMMVLAFLCKQVPAVFGPPALLVAAFLFERRYPWRLLGSIAIGMVLSVVAVLIVGQVAGIDFPHAAAFMFRLPARVGMSRLAQTVQTEVRSWQRLSVIPVQWVLITFPLLQTVIMVAAVRLASAPSASRLARFFKWGLLLEILFLGLAAVHTTVVRNDSVRLKAAICAAIAAATLGAAGWEALRRSHAAAGESPAVPRAERADPVRLLIFAEVLLLVCVASAAIINNAATNSAKYVFVAAGIVHAALTCNVGGAVLDTPWRLPKVGRPLASALILATLLDMISYNLLINRPRHAIHVDHPVAAARSGGEVSPILSFLLWDIPTDYLETSSGGDVRAYAELAQFLRDAGGRYALFGDTSVLYAVTKSPSVAPSLFFHEGLGQPDRDDADLKWYQELFIARMQAARCRYFVMEGGRTYMGTTLEQLPLLRAFVTAHAQRRFDIGNFHIIDFEAEKRPDPRSSTEPG